MRYSVQKLVSLILPLVSLSAPENLLIPILCFLN